MILNKNSRQTRPQTVISPLALQSPLKLSIQAINVFLPSLVVFYYYHSKSLQIEPAKCNIFRRFDFFYGKTFYF